MNKYYVRCGELQVVLLAETPLEAAKKGLMDHIQDGMNLDSDGVYVSEYGFHTKRSYILFPLMGMFQELGFEEM